MKRDSYLAAMRDQSVTMKSARFCLRPLAPWATPWQADTLFGALCWELARSAGESALTRLLQRFREGPPPLLLSDAFPADLLPRPLCAVPEAEVGAAAEAKEWQPARWITRQQFVAIRQGQSYSLELPRQHWWSTVHAMHASVPRDGAYPVPFSTEEYTWRPEIPQQERFLSLYVRAEQEWLERLGALLRALGRSGFGKRRATGRGAFQLLGPAEACDWLEPLPFENAFVSLSHFVPDESDPADGWWETLVKYPRLGSERAATAMPFKGRLVMLRPGSCFRSPGRPRRWYGRVLAGLSPAFPDALHYALAFAVGLRWEASR